MRNRFHVTLAALTVLGLCASPIVRAQTPALNDPWQQSASSPGDTVSGLFSQDPTSVSLLGFTPSSEQPSDGPFFRPAVQRADLPFYAYTLVSPLTPLQRLRLSRTIQIGMSRAQVDRRIPPDGGLTASNLGRYYLGDGVLVDVPYDSTGGPFSSQNRVNGPLRFYPGSFHTD